MSIKTTYKIKTYISQVKTYETYICDCCGKEICKVGYQPEYPNNYHNDITYYLITTGHHDWGNDSIDSIEHFEVCSKECAQHFIDEYFKRAAPNRYNTEYIEINHERVFPLKGEIKDEC